MLWGAEKMLWEHNIFCTYECAVIQIQFWGECPDN